MAGAFSGHLIDSFLSAQQPRTGPFGQPLQQALSNSQLHTHGAMSFAPHAHGTFDSSASASASASLLHMLDPSSSAFMELSAETARRIATLQAKLDRKLGPEFVSQRPGPGGGPKLIYAEGWKMINLANEVFGFNGWSSSIVSLTTDYVDVQEQTGRVSVGVTAVMRVTLRDGVFHEDIGYGQIENMKNKGAALDKCKKEAVTDGLKRTLRNFGNLLGNCLYDKAFTQEIVKIKVPPPKFDRSELHRRPEFAEGSKSATNTSDNAPGPSSESSTRNDANSSVPQRVYPPAKPLTSVPAHLRSSSGPAAATAAAVQGKPSMEYATPIRTNAVASTSNAGAMKGGLITPVQTPAHQPKPNVPSGVIYRQSDIKPQAKQGQGHASTAEKRVAFAQSAEPTTSEDPARPPAPALTVAIPDTNIDDVDPDDESFGLNSEDDAFFASVDLGEGDSGIGGHIDFDEGLGGTSVDGLEAASGSSGEMPQFPVRQRLPPMGQGRREQTSLPQQSRQVGQLTMQGRSRGTASMRPNVSPNASSADSSSSAQDNSTARPPTNPPMGGFHFPHAANVRPGAPQSGSGAGVSLKRSADAMQSGAGTRRPMQGMGLTHQPGGQSRVPLAPLESGDLKRLKR